MKKIRLTGTAVTMAFLMALTGCSKTAETSASTTTVETSAVPAATTGGEAQVGEPVQKLTVYTVSEEKGKEGTFITPGFKLDDSDITEINNDISSYVSGLSKDEWFDGTEYSYYDGGDFVSLLIRGISNIDCDDYKAFNVSAKTGKLMSDEELLAAVGKDSNAFAELVKKTVEDAMADDKEGSLFVTVEDVDYKAMNVSDTQIAKAKPFVSDRGNLCFIYDLNMGVGAEEYTLCLDTVTHEHMLNDFGNWTLYPEWG